MGGAKYNYEAHRTTSGYVDSRDNKDNYDKDAAAGAMLLLEFEKWSDMTSKMVQYGLQSGIMWVSVSDHFRSHIGPHANFGKC